MWVKTQWIIIIYILIKVPAVDKSSDEEIVIFSFIFVYSSILKLNGSWWYILKSSKTDEEFESALENLKKLNSSKKNTFLILMGLRQFNTTKHQFWTKMM